MTILSLESFYLHMQSSEKDSFGKFTGCSSNPNKIDSNKMAMSVGSSDGESTNNNSNNSNNNNNNNSSSNNNRSKAMGKQRAGKRPGRKPTKIDERAKLERSRQSAKECRARKKLRYQYLEELVLNREKAVFSLREELAMCTSWCEKVDKGVVPSDLQNKMADEEAKEKEMTSEQTMSPDDPDEDLTLVDFSSELTFHDLHLSAHKSDG